MYTLGHDVPVYKKIMLNRNVFSKPTLLMFGVRPQVWLDDGEVIRLVIAFKLIKIHTV